MAWRNLPNAITLGRIVLAAVVAPMLLTDSFAWRMGAFVVFLVAAFSDLWDGHLARSRNLISDFGKLMDPLADKLLVTAALVSLVSLGRLEAWIAMVIIAREFAVTGLRGVAAEHGVVIQASWLGKLKTMLQVAAIICLIAVDPAPLGIDLLVYAAVAVTVISGVDYFFGFRRMARARRSQAA
jgi:CDP-diacylglycerol--glycerol-3-phosphate 3-phosphatidyltransferase